MTRRESRNVFSENPAVFMQDLQQAIHDGFRVSNTNEGYPMLNSILKEVRVYRSDDSFTAPMPDDVTSQYVAEWDGMRYLLAFQNLVLQGFEVDTQSVSFDGMKTAKMVRVHSSFEDAKQDAAIADLQGNANLSTETDFVAQFRATQSQEEEEMAAPEKPEPTSVVEELAQEGTATTALNPEPTVDNDNRAEDQQLTEEQNKALVEEREKEEAPKKTTRRKAAKKVDDK